MGYKVPFGSSALLVNQTLLPHPAAAVIHRAISTVSPADSRTTSSMKMFCKLFYNLPEVNPTIAKYR